MKQVRRFSRCEVCNMEEYIELSKELLQCDYCDTQYRIIENDKVQLFDEEKVKRLRLTLLQALGRELSEYSTNKQMDKNKINETLLKLKSTADNDPYVQFFENFMCASRSLEPYLNALAYALNNLEISDGREILKVALKSARNDEGYFIKNKIENDASLKGVKDYLLPVLENYDNEDNGEKENTKQSSSSIKSSFAPPMYKVVEGHFHEVSSSDFDHSSTQAYWDQIIHWISEWEPLSSLETNTSYVIDCLKNFSEELSKLDLRDLNDDERETFAHESFKDVQNAIVLHDNKAYAKNFINEQDIDHTEKAKLNKLIHYYKKPERVHQLIDEVKENNQKIGRKRKND